MGVGSASWKMGNSEERVGRSMVGGKPAEKYHVCVCRGGCLKQP